MSVDKGNLIRLRVSKLPCYPLKIPKYKSDTKLGSSASVLINFFIGSYTNNSRSGAFLTNSEAGSSYMPNLDFMARAGILHISQSKLG